MLLWLAKIGQMGSFLSVLIVSARSTIKSKSILRGAWWFYGLGVAGVFLFCVVIPALLVGLGVNGHVVVHSFPEAIAVMPVILVGWFVGLAFATPVRAAHALTDEVRKRTAPSPGSHGDTSR